MQKDRPACLCSMHNKTIYTVKVLDRFSKKWEPKTRFLNLVLECYVCTNCTICNYHMNTISYKNLLLNMQFIYSFSGGSDTNNSSNNIK